MKPAFTPIGGAKLLGVGPARVALLADRGILTAYDVLRFNAEPGDPWERLTQFGETTWGTVLAWAAAQDRDRQAWTAEAERRRVAEAIRAWEEQKQRVEEQKQRVAERAAEEALREFERQLRAADAALGAALEELEPMPVATPPEPTRQVAKPPLVALIFVRVLGGSALVVWLGAGAGIYWAWRGEHDLGAPWLTGALLTAFVILGLLIGRLWWVWVAGAWEETKRSMQARVDEAYQAEVAAWQDASEAARTAARSRANIASGREHLRALREGGVATCAALPPVSLRIEGDERRTRDAELARQAALDAARAWEQARAICP